MVEACARDRAEVDSDSAETDEEIAEMTEDSVDTSAEVEAEREDRPERAEFRVPSLKLMLEDAVARSEASE